MFRPPLARGMLNLDRAFFQKSISLQGARVFDNKNIAKIRSQLERSKDALHQDRLGSVYSDPDPEREQAGKKCVLLRPETREVSGSHTGVVNGNARYQFDGAPPVHWAYSSVLTDLLLQKLIAVIPYQLHLDYNYWTYHDIISSILPLDAQDEIPSGFSQVGHVAHLNLRDEYLSYKTLIAEILLDKNPNIRTVINKIDDVGEENEFRTFKYEVLAGPDEMEVTVSHENCTFVFDYSKVYWNTRLHTEHARLVQQFQPGEAVCDVMAGIGPFAAPAGKKGVFVWANDLNPDSYSSLTDAVQRNKVGQYVRPFNEDGNAFIRSAVARLLDDEHEAKMKNKLSRKGAKQNGATTEELSGTVKQPKTFNHFVLNLPASAINFLPSFIGLYPPSIRSNLPDGATMPLIHVYCFNTKDEQSAEEGTVNSEHSATDKICAEISEQLQFPMTAGKIADGGVEVYDVRDVAPKKRMFCASFRLPQEVASRSG